MSNIIDLSELVDAIDMQNDEIRYYVNKQENQLVFVMDDVYCDEEDNKKH